MLCFYVNVYRRRYLFVYTAVYVSISESSSKDTHMLGIWSLCFVTYTGALEQIPFFNNSGIGIAYESALYGINST